MSEMLRVRTRVKISYELLQYEIKKKYGEKSVLTCQFNFFLYIFLLYSSLK